MTAPTYQPIGVRDPVAVVAREHELLEILRRSPEGLRIPEIIPLLSGSEVGDVRSPAAAVAAR